VFLEEAGGLAVLVADDAAPGRIRRLGRDPGHAKGDRVDDGHVPAGARQYGRVVGRHAVEIPASRVALDVETRVIVTPPLNPVPGGLLRRGLGEALQQAVERGRCGRAGVDLGQVETVVDRVAVVVVQA